MIDNLKFTYAEGVIKDELAESTMRTNVNMWLSPLENEINDKNVIVGILFLSDNKRHIALIDADCELYCKFIDQMRNFVI